MRRPLILIALSFTAGILVGNTALYFPWTAIIVSALGIAGLFAHARRSGRSLAQPVLMSVSMAAGALLLITSAVRVSADHYTRRAPPDGSSRRVSGRIASPLDREPGRTAFLINVDSIDGAPASGTVRASVRDDRLALGYGDRISVRGGVHPPRGSRNPGGFDYPAHLARQGVFAVMSIRRPDDIVVTAQGRGLLRAVQDRRERIRQAFLRSTTGDGSAVLQAMVLGEEGGLTDGLRERFMAAGVTHILSISGSHLGLVAIICFWTVRRLLFLLPERRYHELTIRLDPRKAAAVVTVLPVTFYAFLAGGQVATIRSLIMILAGLTAVIVDRESDLLSALAPAALVTLVPHPQTLFDVSFQLSYLSVVTIVYVVDAWNRLDLRAEAGPRKWLNNGLLLLCISVAVALATGPLVAHHFNQASFAGIIANMVVVPFAGAVVVPLGLFSGVLSVFTGDLPLAALVQAVADAFVALVSLFSALPGAMVRLPSPGPLFLAGYAGIVIAGAVWGRSLLFACFRPLEFPSRTPRSALITAAVASLLLLAAAASPLIRGGATRVTFIDVGQGDSALVETAGGAAILIDGGGTRDNRFAVGRRIVSPYLADRGVRSLDLVVLSHPHPDHMNGLLTIVEDFRVREVWWSGHDGHLEGFEDLRRKLEERHVPLRRVAAGSSAVIGDAVLDVIYPAGNPLAGKQRAYAAENDRSLVVRLRVEARTFLFPGDLHRESEAALIALGRDISADVLKVPHHGSRSSSMSAFVRAVGPSMAVISVGAGNPYHHPAEEVIDRYRSAGAEIHRTDRDGAVIIEVRGATLAATRWTDLQLQKFDVGRVSRWGGQERENWRKVWIRTTGI